MIYPLTVLSVMLLVRIVVSYQACILRQQTYSEKRHESRKVYSKDKGETFSTHASSRPLIRRAHWHHFWTGPRDGERKLILQWLPPIPVGADDEELPVVLNKVQ